MNLFKKASPKVNATSLTLNQRSPDIILMDEFATQHIKHQFKLKRFHELQKVRDTVV